MCGGNPGPSIKRVEANPATINVPNYEAYDRQWDLQASAITGQIESRNRDLQMSLDAVQKKNLGIKEQLRDLAKKRAEDQAALEEKAQRLSLLMGPPPPEKPTSAIETGTRDRDINTRKGKGALRIGRTRATSSGKGAGLNIT